MANWAFRYIAEENLVSVEQLVLLDKLISIPSEEAEELTDDELSEEFDPSVGV